MAKRQKRLQAGDRVRLMVRCKNMHLWVIYGTLKEDGSMACGEVSAPGAPDDPTCCKECGEPFEGSYFGMERDTREPISI